MLIECDLMNDDGVLGLPNTNENVSNNEQTPHHTLGLQTSK